MVAAGCRLVIAPATCRGDKQVTGHAWGELTCARVQRAATHYLPPTDYTSSTEYLLRAMLRCLLTPASYLGSTYYLGST